MAACMPMWAERMAAPEALVQDLSSGHEVWSQAIGATRSRASGTFDQWFSSVQFDGLGEGVLRLRARDAFVRQWVEDHFVPFLAESIREQTGWSVQVAWTIDSDLTEPVVRELPSASRTVQVCGPRGSRGANQPEEEGRAGGPRSAVQLVAPPLEGLNPRYTFANFVVGSSNQLAHAASIAASGGGGQRYNPLFLCGGTGLGKTHLIQAVAHRVRQECPSTSIVYVSAERFVNEFVQALAGHAMQAFRARYRERCDLLLIDDIQILASKPQTQEEFFHAFNVLHQAGKPIIVTCDKYPQQLDRMEERLVSRFTWGLVADIQSPELETRVAILHTKAKTDGIFLPEDVALCIAQTVRSNVRELEGALVRLVAKSSLMGGGLDRAFVEKEFAATVGFRGGELHIEEVQRLVCHHFHLRSGELVSKDRHRTLSFARHIAMYLCKKNLGCSLPEIGRAFGNRDHTTVLSAVRKLDARRKDDAELRAHLDVLEKKIGYMAP